MILVMLGVMEVLEVEGLQTMVRFLQVVQELQVKVTMEVQWLTVLLEKIMVQEEAELELPEMRENTSNASASASSSVPRFNPKAPRHTVYPAGPNSPGALHFGIDLEKPNDYIRKKMPEWEEPPVHMDLVTFDST